MPTSRIDRFKAALKDELDKIPNKPSTSLAPRAELEDISNQVQHPNETSAIMDATEEIEHPTTSQQGQSPPMETAFSQLDIDDLSYLDSDDSEAGCSILIEAVDSDDESTNGAPTNNDHRKPVSLDTSTRVGEVTIHGEAFCPIQALAKYPYKFVPKAHSQAVASAVFDGGKFWQREWDFFYIWPLESADKPIIFVREEQFVQLLKEIDARFPTLHIDPRDSYFRHIKLVTTFPHHPRLLPRYLGRSKSRDDYDKATLRVPAQRPFTYPRGEAEPDRAPTDDEVAEFNDICDTTIDLGRVKSRSKNKRQGDRAAARANLMKQLKRAQRYFGLRERTDETKVMPPIDITKSPPYPLEEDVIITSVDLEAWERSHSIITEIGIATLDTRDIKDIAPGHLGENWRSKIRARHFRIREHMMYVNHEFVTGAPDRFEKDFGTTEFIDKKDASRVVASCFKEPFSKPLTGEEINASWEEMSQSQEQEQQKEKRNIIFLGHNPAADVRYLKTIGYDPSNLINLREFMDTASLYRAHKNEQNPRGVGGILSEFDLVGWNLHNAGNDAVYTLWIMLATIVAEASSRGKDKVDERGDEVPN